MIVKLYSFDYNVRVIIFTVFAAEQSHTTRMLRGATNHFHPPGNKKKNLYYWYIIIFNQHFELLLIARNDKRTD